MLVFSADQMQRITRAAFLTRLHGFLLQRARSPALRQALDDPDQVLSFWRESWPQAASEHDAAVHLTFMLACRAENLDLGRARQLAATGGERAELAMKRFLSERGHLRFSDFDSIDEAPVAQEN